MSDMCRLINNADHSDVMFIVEGRPVYAHRSVLAVRCDHFRCGAERTVEVWPRCGHRAASLTLVAMPVLRCCGGAGGCLPRG